MSVSRSKPTYLNIILTVNAVLLSAIVWTQLGSGPAWSAAANAQNPPQEGIPNAGAQRQRQVQELEAIRESVDAMRKQLDSGKMKVTISNVDDFKAAMAASDKSK